LTLLGMLIVATAAVIGLALASLSPTMYVARADIEYHLRVENATYFMRTDANLADQTLLLTDRSVLGPVATAQGVPVDELSSNVTATIVDNSEIIQLDVRDPNRDNGVALANAIIKQYLTVLNSTSPTAAIQRQLDDARRALSTAIPAAAPALQARVTMLQGQIDMANIMGNTAQVAVPAYSVTTPASPNRPLGVGVGALCGGVLAALTTIILYRRWTAAGQRPGIVQYPQWGSSARPPALPDPARR
jgi:hypothetical protein